MVRRNCGKVLIASVRLVLTVSFGFESAPVLRGNTFVIMLADSYEQQLPEQTERPIPTLEIWAGKDEAKQVKELAKRNLDAQFGKGSTQVSDNP